MSISEILLSPDFLFVVLRVTTPILFATLAVLMAAKSGIFNIAVEGIMLTSALVGVIFSSKFQNPWIGLLAALLIGALMGILLGVLVIRLKTDAILAGVAINLMAGGGTIFLLYLVSGDRGVSSSLKSISLPNIVLPIIENIPFLGTVLSKHNVLTYAVFIFVILVHLVLYKTPLGLKIRAVGENSHAAESVGINVHKIQYIALGLSGMFAAFGGAFLSMGYLSWFTNGMTAGRGYIGLAANAMGGSTPIGGLIVSLVFGIADAMANVFQTGIDVPYELVQMIPYITTIVGLAVYSFNRKKKLERITKK
ncbi:MAG: ABC transporter permease [Gudongella sp.]|nr:ABC transporter permease [Gudongella sp.]